MSTQIHEEIINKKINELSLHLDCLKQIPLWYPPKIWRVIHRSKLQVFEIYDLIGHLGISHQDSLFDEFEDILFSMISLMGIIGLGGIVWFLYQKLYDNIMTFFTKKLVVFGITWWTEQPSWFIGTIGAIIVLLMGYVLVSWLMKKFWVYRIQKRLNDIQFFKEKGNTP